MNAVTALPATLASLLIALAVVLSGTHAKDLATLPAQWLDAKKADDTGQHAVKVAVELHSHVDKSIKVQPGADSGQQADGRSLRLLHQNKKDHTQRNRIADRLRLLWQSGAWYLG